MADSQNLMSEPWIEGAYMEGASSRTKTSNRASSRLKEQVLVGLVTGIIGANWCSKWLALRKSLGLQVAEDQLLLPVRLADGRWSSAAVDGYELTLNLRHIFIKGGAAPQQLQTVGRYSCKCTCLSWLAKAGVGAEINERREGFEDVEDYFTEMAAFRREDAARRTQPEGVNHNVDGGVDESVASHWTCGRCSLVVRRSTLVNCRSCNLDICQPRLPNPCSFRIYIGCIYPPGSAGIPQFVYECKECSARGDSDSSGDPAAPEPGGNDDEESPDEEACEK